VKVVHNRDKFGAWMGIYNIELYCVIREQRRCLQGTTRTLQIYIANTTACMNIDGIK